MEKTKETNKSKSLGLPGYDKKLAIIVPYRDRQEQLTQFLLHMDNYFERDKLDKNIDYSIHVVEQLEKAPFNRGMIKNCGFSITKDDADYFCFHDVDYLPLWADYSFVERPTRIIWHGLTLKEDYDNFFGGVIMFNTKDFLKVNGYSNEYWGWGFEDYDLKERCVVTGLGFEKRDGTFYPLPHSSEGSIGKEELSDIGHINGKLFQKKRKTLKKTYMQDGLSTLSFELDRTTDVIIDDKPAKNVFFHKVRI